MDLSCEVNWARPDRFFDFVLASHRRMHLSLAIHPTVGHLIRLSSACETTYAAQERHVVSGRDVDPLSMFVCKNS